MNERQREILRKARPQLVDTIVDVEGICDRLTAKEVLTEGMVDDILIKGTRKRLVRALLDIVPRRGKNAYDYFYEALIDTGNKEAAYILKPEFAELNPEQKQMLKESKQAEKMHPIGEKVDPLKSDKLSDHDLDPQNLGVNASLYNENVSMSSSESSSTFFNIRDSNIRESNAVQPSNCSENNENTMEVETIKSEESQQETWTLPEPTSSVSSSRDSTSISQPENPVQTMTTQESNEDFEYLGSWPSSEAHTSLKITVKLASAHIKQEMNNDTAYNTMNCGSPGRVVILNIFSYKGLPGLTERKNTDSDATAIGLLLKKYGFKVTTHKNPTFKEVTDLLEKERTIDDCKYGCFMLIIMAHGEGKTIYSSDGKMNLDNILELLDDEHLPGLKDKPKVVLVQACQATVKKSAASEETEQSEPEKPDSLENFDSLVSMEGAASQQALLRNDMFIARATLDEQLLYRDEEFGSKFIRAFTYVMQEVSHKEDLLRIMERVNKVLGGTATDIPAVQYASSLKKKFYFCASK